MSLINDKFGQVRLVWRLILIILLYVSTAVLLRFIPIQIIKKYLIGKGVPQTTALERANEIISENPVWLGALGILFGLVGLLIVWFLITKIEKSEFNWIKVGLDWKRNSLLMILTGGLLAFLNYFGSMFTWDLLSPIKTSQILISIDVNILFFLQKLIFYIAMGFGEEIVFRGYVQKRCVRRLNTTWGILLSALIFVLLHQIFYDLSLITILSGVILWFIIGMLYHLSKSLYLSISFHGMMNTLMNTLDPSFDDIDVLIVHSVLLLFVIVVAFLMKKLQISRRIKK